MSSPEYIGWRGMEGKTVEVFALDRRRHLSGREWVAEVRIQFTDGSAMSIKPNSSESLEVMFRPPLTALPT